MSTAAAAAAAADHKSGMRPRAFAEGPEPKRTSASEAVARSNGSAAASDALGAAPPPGATGAAAAAASDAPAAVRRTIARRTTSRAAADVARARTMAQLTSLAKGSSAESAAYQRPCFEYHTGGGMCKNEGNCAFAHGDVNAVCAGARASRGAVVSDVCARDRRRTSRSGCGRCYPCRLNPPRASARRVHRRVGRARVRVPCQAGRRGGRVPVHRRRAPGNMRALRLRPATVMRRTTGRRRLRTTTMTTSSTSTRIRRPPSFGSTALSCRVATAAR